MAGSLSVGFGASRSKVSDKGDEDEGRKKMKAPEKWFEMELRPDLKLSLALKRVIRHRRSDFQEIMILDTESFGRVLVIDGKPQISEADGFVYYESLVHPALLMHNNPKRVFIMGGGNGFAAREVLRHKTIEHIILCEKDQDVINICGLCFEENWGAMADPRLQTVIYDAREVLEYTSQKYDVIIGDLPAPTEGDGSCNAPYTESFYQSVIKPRLNEDGIFVTHAGLAGIRSHNAFSSIFNTLQTVFQFAVPVTVAVPLHADTCGWVMASDMPLVVSYVGIDKRIEERVEGKLQYHDGGSILAATIMNKIICKPLSNYTRDYIIDDDHTTDSSGG